MISNFTGDYDFLHNTYPCSVQWWGGAYLSVEHAYHALKACTAEVREQIREMKYISAVIRFADTMEIRDDWPSLKLEMMRNLVAHKFIIHQDLCIKLLATDPHVLVYENSSNDTFWGTKQRVGDNHLGKILMEVRQRLWEIPSNREIYKSGEAPQPFPIRPKPRYSSRVYPKLSSVR